MMEEITPVLKAFEIATTTACGEETVSISDVYPVVCGLMNNHLQPADNDERDARIITFINAVREALGTRFLPWDTETASLSAVVAAALDPRHKRLRFLSPAVRAAAKTRIVDIFQMEKEKERARPDEEEGDEGEEEERSPGAKKTKSSAMAFLIGAVEDDDHNVGSELEQYFSLRAIPLEASPLLWWKTHEVQYPIMARLARRFLCIPATSVASERIFSAAGQVVSKLRSRLLPDNVNKLIFLNKNLHREERAKKKAAAV